jgi:hypothetical protein
VKLIRKSDKDRILIIFPYLEKMLDNEGINLIWQEIATNDWVLALQNSLYWVKLDKIIESSSKMNKIKQLLKDLDKD